MPKPTRLKSPRPPCCRRFERNPAERLAELEAEAAARGIKPMDERAYAKFLETLKGQWPEGKDIDDFVESIRAARHQGRNRRSKC